MRDYFLKFVPAFGIVALVLSVTSLAMVYNHFSRSPETVSAVPGDCPAHACVEYRKKGNAREPGLHQN